VAEREDALFTHFVLATQEEAEMPERRVECADTSAIARAEEYIRAHLTRPVSRAELATLAGVSIRTLSRGFKKRRGTGPMSFLKTRRLEVAYPGLLGAEADATSVTEVALRYGFTRFGRFAVEYKRAFRESPSETLRH
jgi:transcriptional regulator GlxA family with amidase domain